MICQRARSAGKKGLAGTSPDRRIRAFDASVRSISFCHLATWSFLSQDLYSRTKRSSPGQTILVLGGDLGLTFFHAFIPRHQHLLGLGEFFLLQKGGAHHRLGVECGPFVRLNLLANGQGLAELFFCLHGVLVGQKHRTLNGQGGGVSGRFRILLVNRAGLFRVAVEPVSHGQLVAAINALGMIGSEQGLAQRQRTPKLLHCLGSIAHVQIG